jgi:hypothetical protein
MKAHQKSALLGLFAIVLSSATSCVTTEIKKHDMTGLPVSDWVLASRSLQGDIDAHAEALPWTHGVNRIDMITWFAGVGEPAYDTLLAFLEDERPEVVATSLAALGATSDPRLVGYLRAAEQPNWGTNILMESARARVRLGDWDAMPPLIDGLESEKVFVRSMCVQSLYEATREKMGYDSHAALPARKAAVARWRAWWENRSADELLVRSE